MLSWLAGDRGGVIKTPSRRRWLVARGSAAALVLALMTGLVLVLGATGGSASTLKLVQGNGGALGPLARTASESAPGGGTACVINSLPSFMDQGEFSKSSSIADIVEVECEPVYAEHTIRFSSAELYSRCQHHLSWSLPYPYAPQSGSSFPVTLDNDGNATAVISGGPSCAAGESLISAHMEQAPYLTVTTPFVVLPPRTSPPGVYALPKRRGRERGNQQRGHHHPRRVPAGVRRGLREHQRRTALLPLSHPAQTGVGGRRRRKAPGRLHA